MWEKIRCWGQSCKTNTRDFIKCVRCPCGGRTLNIFHVVLNLRHTCNTETQTFYNTVHQSLQREDLYKYSLEGNTIMQRVVDSRSQLLVERMYWQRAEETNKKPQHSRFVQWQITCLLFILEDLFTNRLGLSAWVYFHWWRETYTTYIFLLYSEKIKHCNRQGIVTNRVSCWVTIIWWVSLYSHILVQWDLKIVLEQQLRFPRCQ